MGSAIDGHSASRTCSRIAVFMRIALEDNKRLTSKELANIRSQLGQTELPQSTTSNSPTLAGKAS